MKEFEQLQNTYDNIKSGNLKPENFYSELWAKMVLLSSEEKDQVLKFSEEFSALDETLKGLDVFAQALHRTFVSDFSKGSEFATDAIERFTKENNQDGLLSACCIASICYRSTGQLDKAQMQIQKALSHYDKKNSDGNFKYFHGVTFYQAGELSQQFGNYEAALKYYSEGLTMDTGMPEFNGRMFSGLGVTHMMLENWEKAIEFFELGIKAIAGSNNKLLESKILSDIGIYYFKTKDLQKAKEYQLKSLGIREKNNLFNAATTNYIQLAEIYQESGNYKEAIEYANKAIAHAEKMNTLIKLFEAHSILSRAYESSGDIQKALFHLKQFNKYKDEVHNQEVMRKVEQLNNKHKMESLEKEQEIFKLRNVELKAAFDEVENKQKEILDSIHYAKRIQTALMPPEKNIEKCINRLRELNH